MTDFSWEPKGDRFALISSSDPNVGNPGQGVTIKTDVSFYQHERSKGDFKLLRTLPQRTPILPVLRQPPTNETNIPASGDWVGGTRGVIRT